MTLPDLPIAPVGHSARLLRAGRRFGKPGEQTRMELTAEAIREGLDTLAARERGFARVLAAGGYPEPRVRERGYRTLLRAIVGQQVSVAAAASMWRKLEAELGEDIPTAELLARDYDTLRACGLSRQKQGYVRSLCELVEAGAIDFDNLPADDEEAIALLTRIKGIGRWTAEIYLLFAEQRPDIWPAGDLAVQAGIGAILGLDGRPSEKQARPLAEAWRPHRGATALLAWHVYNNPAL
jgi:DNA-3-methyladenine glycosylase II